MSFVAEQSPNVRAKKEAANRVNDLPRPNFIFFYCPDDWHVDFRGKLMPTVVHISKEPGSGAVSPDGDFAPQELALKKRGFLPIDHEVIAADTDYVAPYRNRKGRVVHRTVFQRPYATVEGVTNWAFDQDAWDDFIALLRAKGVIRRPRPEILSGMLEQQRELLRNKRSPRTDDGEAIERYNEKIKRIHAAIDVLTAEVAASEKEYGKSAAPGRVVVLDQLKAARAEAEAIAPAVQVRAATVAPAKVTKATEGRRKPAGKGSAKGTGLIAEPAPPVAGPDVDPDLDDEDDDS